MRGLGVVDTNLKFAVQLNCADSSVLYPSTILLSEKSNSGLNPVYVQCASAWTSIPWQKMLIFSSLFFLSHQVQTKKNKALLHNNTVVLYKKVS